EAFVDLYGRQRDSVFRSSWSSIVTVFVACPLSPLRLNPLLCFPQKTSVSQDCSSSKLLSHSLRVFLLCPQTQRQKRQEMNALPTDHERMEEKKNNEVKETRAAVSMAELAQISK
ncbi:hypothetical protein QQF64_014405, partial [Cirrhinus molitorella]